MSNPYLSNRDTSTPNMVFSSIEERPTQDSRYRVGMFTIGRDVETDEASALEALMTRSLDPEGGVTILNSKDSISQTTGIYTVIVHYIERTPSQEENRNA